MKKLLLSYIILLLLSAGNAMAYGNDDICMTDICLFDYIETNFDDLEYETKLITCSLTEVDHIGFQHSVACIEFRFEVQADKNLVAKQLKRSIARGK